MKCLACSYDNPGTAAFCKGCGAKLDLSVDEIQSAMVETQKDEKKKATEYWLRQTMFLSFLGLVAAITFYVFAGAQETDSYFVPSARGEAALMRIEPKVEIEPQLKPIMFELRKSP